MEIAPDDRQLRRARATHGRRGRLTLAEGLSQSRTALSAEARSRHASTCSLLPDACADFGVEMGSLFVNGNGWSRVAGPLVFLNKLESVGIPVAATAIANGPPDLYAMLNRWEQLAGGRRLHRRWSRDHAAPYEEYLACRASPRARSSRSTRRGETPALLQRARPERSRFPPNCPTRRKMIQGAGRGRRSLQLSFCRRAGIAGA